LPGNIGKCHAVGIQEAYYLAPDPYSGMVNLRDKLPPVWQEIAKGRIYREADCSPELKEMAIEMFRSSADELDRRLGTFRWKGKI